MDNQKISLKQAWLDAKECEEAELQEMWKADGRGDTAEYNRRRDLAAQAQVKRRAAFRAYCESEE